MTELTTWRCPKCEPGEYWNPSSIYCGDHGEKLQNLPVRRLCKCGVQKGVFKFCIYCGEPTTGLNRE